MKQKLLRPIASLTAVLIWLVSSSCYLVADDLKVALAANQLLWILIIKI